MDVVPGARMQHAVAIDQGPAFAAVFAAPQTALARLGFEQGVDPVRVAGGHVHRDFADQFRQTAPEFLPAVPAVAGLVQPAAFTAGLDEPGLASVMPHAGIQDARVGRVHRKIRSARVRVGFEDLFPGIPAIGGPVNAPLLVGPPDLALNGHVGDIRILGVDFNF